MSEWRPVQTKYFWLTANSRLCKCRSLGPLHWIPEICFGVLFFEFYWYYGHHRRLLFLELFGKQIVLIGDVLPHSKDTP